MKIRIESYDKYLWLQNYVRGKQGIVGKMSSIGGMELKSTLLKSILEIFSLFHALERSV